jgi:hypothetical protein
VVRDLSDGQVLECTSSDLLWRALRIDTARHSRQDQMRVASVMARLGWPKFRPNTQRRAACGAGIDQMEDGDAPA